MSRSWKYAGMATVLGTSMALSTMMSNLLPTKAAEPTAKMSEAETEASDIEIVINMDDPADIQTPVEAFRVWTEREEYLLARISMAEAESENVFGKALVMQVVINRVEDSEFPDDIESVIFQEDAFSPIKDGRWDKVEPNADCYAALEIVRTSCDNIAEGALYFESSKSANNWHSRHLTYLFQYGRHRFYE